MTTRRWMIAVAVVGLLCLLEHRRRSFEALAAYHHTRVAHFVIVQSLDDVTVIRRISRDRKPLATDEVKVATWHEAMARKYRQAARNPWLPVEPDPPEPK
jgi:hypothetical protein